jgi:iron complex outermembrane receptor protein
MSPCIRLLISRRFSLDVENLLDSRANRFSFGNPFSVAGGTQRTPLRPRTVRIGIGIDAQF